MAIINCPECGKEISDKAKSCPHCGYPIESKETVIEETAPIEYGDFSIDCGDFAKLSKHVYNVYIDKHFWNTLERNTEKTDRLSFGEHKIKIVDKTSGVTVYKGTICLDDDYPQVCCYFNPKTNLLEYIEDAANEFVADFVEDDCDEVYETRRQGAVCPKCGGHMTMTTVTEDKHAGCGTVLLYIILATFTLGLFLILLLLRKKSEAVTYAVCDCCGYRRRVS